MKIETERLILRKPRMSDVDFIVNEFKDRGLSIYIPVIPFPYKKKDAEWFIKNSLKQWKKGESREFMIVLKNTKKAIGVATLSKIDIKNKNSMAGCWLSRKYWRDGYMTEAFIRLLEMGFNEMKLKRIWAIITDLNPRSPGLVEKLGFRKEGHLLGTQKVKGKWVGDFMYGLLKEEWQVKRKTYKVKGKS